MESPPPPMSAQVRKGSRDPQTRPARRSRPFFSTTINNAEVAEKLEESLSNGRNPACLSG